ncbi:hypothetical protein EDC96DRAFT_34310 [Choanephora cucurbitarum]|nr:hypothetical protein EDC96DRAFT_34160 [Choanephora cucurbitarum]KAI8331260.1 hypothetical protein EDC96DRAFT_34310 [Choanephora cucurbitarum]
MMSDKVCGNPESFETVYSSILAIISRKRHSISSFLFLINILDTTFSFIYILLDFNSLYSQCIHKLIAEINWVRKSVVLLTSWIRVYAKKCYDIYLFLQYICMYYLFQIDLSVKLKQIYTTLYSTI